MSDFVCVDDVGQLFDGPAPAIGEYLRTWPARLANQRCGIATKLFDSLAEGRPCFPVRSKVNSKALGRLAGRLVDGARNEGKLAI